MDKNGKALVEHWQWASSKGLMNVTSARLLRNACFQVLSAQDGWEDLDVGALDIEETFRRFQNIKGRNLSPGSLKDYHRRFSQGVQSFLDYLRDPPNWKGPLGNVKPPRVAGGQEGRSAGHAERNGRMAAPRRNPPEKHGELIEYPFPIRTGLTARLTLPGDLTISEAKRLASFVASLAIDSAADPVSG